MYIETVEELKKYVGQKVSCSINGEKVDEALVVEDLDNDCDMGIYLMQNVCEGERPESGYTHGYKYSYVLPTIGYLNITGYKVDKVKPLPPSLVGKTVHYGALLNLKGLVIHDVGPKVLNRYVIVGEKDITKYTNGEAVYTYNERIVKAVEKKTVVITVDGVKKVIEIEQDELDKLLGKD